MKIQQMKVEGYKYVKFDFLKEEGVEVIYLPRTPDISTTQIKQELKNKEII